ncbi:MAG: IS21 family transposase [Gemmatimonadaceae bacterium]|nr:IS21 family transposase [Gemmatimonadaceae bacterium]
MSTAARAYEQAQDVGAGAVPATSSGQPWPGAATMVAETVVEQVVQALGRGTPIAEVARAFALDRKTVRSWGRRGGYVPRAARPAVSRLDAYRDWLEKRASEVDYNATVLHRELTEQGFKGSVIIVRRAVRALRQAAAPPVATVRFETAPGEQAQVDFAQVRVWIADVAIAAQIFVMTLGFSRRCFAVAFARQRLREWLAGHEQAFQHFGGVTDRVVVDNAKAMVLTHTRAAIRWHPTYADFAGYYGFRPWACAPYRPQTKGKVESGVKYVARNALAGRRFHSWAHLNAWLVEWATTVADVRVHGTTHEPPAERFRREALTPLDGRPPYAWTHKRERVVASDALVSIDGSRYSVPAHLAGTIVTVREHATDFTIWQGDTVVATHARQGRRQVVMEPAHYAGLLRVDRTRLAAPPPQYDLRYAGHGEVTARDLEVYERFAAMECPT